MTVNNIINLDHEKKYLELQNDCEKQDDRILGSKIFV